MCPAGHRRVCVPLGEDEASVPEAGPRGSQDRLDEADVSAQEAPPSQGARLSRPHEDDRGTPDPGRAASSGSEATDGLTSDRGTPSPRLVMLSRPQDFAAIQERGTTRSHPLFSARFLRTDLSTTRFGISTGRKLGSAVVRNRVRRRLREALRVMAPSFQPGWDVLIIARPGIVAADHDALVGALQRTLVRGGALGGTAG
jgi:ribonuclease P protein component